MNFKSSRVLLFCFFVFFGFFSKSCFSDYVEGTDTTDANGYGLDSAFGVAPTGQITGQKIVYYGYITFTQSGMFNYLFDDIKMGMDPIRDNVVRYSTGIPSYCFVIKRSKDSTYSKVQILKKLIDGRFVFQFGSNSTPNNRTLESPNYDRSIRYKPNNLNLFYTYGSYFSWDPPLPSNNHLKGYILYVQKANASIDTSAPINLSQWDSVGFTDSTNLFYSSSSYGKYFNLVAVYTEGKSDFLQGWTKLNTPDNIKSKQMPYRFQYSISIRERSDGYLFEINNPMARAVLIVYNMAGRQVAHLSNIRNNSFFWSTSDQNLSEGVYIVKAELPDKTVLSQKFMFSR